MRTLLLLLIGSLGVLKTPAQESSKNTTSIELQASTPCDAVMKTMLHLKETGVIDFIRWNLVLSPNNSFELNLKYGESQPNTLGFKVEYHQAIKGTFTVQKSTAPKGDIYQLSATDSGIRLSFIKLNADLYHLLGPDQQLMLGNGGWSYCLNRKTPTRQKAVLPNLAAATLSKATPYVAVYDGRTPCSELAEEYAIPVSDECIKLKWRFTLYRDSVTLKPTTYTAIRIFRRAEPITGKWSIEQKGDATIYQLHPDDKKDEALQFLVGDDNVLFFLDKQQRLMVGDENFSFALNRKLK
jgi:hypothetical protein